MRYISLRGPAVDKSAPYPHPRLDSLVSQWNSGISTLDRTVQYGALRGEDPNVKHYRSRYEDVLKLQQQVRKHQNQRIWQMRHSSRVKKAIKRGFSELDSMYLALTMATASHSLTEGNRILQLLRERRKLAEQRQIKRAPIVIEPCQSLLPPLMVC